MAVLIARECVSEDWKKRVAFVNQNEPLWQEFAGLIRDEGLELYDLEQAARSALKVTISKPIRGGESSAPSGDAGEQVDLAPGVDAGVDAAGTTASSAVTSGDCSRICRRLMAFCEAEGARLGISAEPELDVSSPGLDRSLRLPTHYETAIGEMIKFVPASDAPWGEHDGKPIVGVIRGELEKVEDGNLFIREERTKVILVAPFRAVKRANVEFSPESNGKKK